MNLARGHSANLDTFYTATIAAEDSNSRPGRFQKLRERLDERVIGVVLHCRSLQPNFKRAVHFPGELVFAGAGLYTNRDYRGAVTLLDL
ncbi:MAG TPA: hypothetical protein VGR55_06755 [Candidatus Acidoferrum sp.]|nr:hypothetical protein [Candidatus Acidoferrum sp.]